MIRLLTLLTLLGCHGDEKLDDHARHAETEGGHAQEAAEPSGHEGHGEEVTLSPEAITAARIVVAPAKASALQPELTLAGRIALDPRKEALLSAWISGQIDSIKVQPGDTVKEGQVLAEVRSPELGEAVAAYRSAKAADEAADARLERLKRLEAEGVSSRAQVLEAEAAHAEAEGALGAATERLRVLGINPRSGDVHAGERYASTVAVRSPIPGKVLSVDAAIGQQVEPGTALFHMGDLDEVWLVMDVYERDLATVRAGQALRFTVEAWPAESFEGTIAQVGDLIEADSRALEVRASVPNPGHRLKPGMFAQARVASVSGTSAVGVVLPAEAVQEVQGRTVVFVEEEPGRFAARPVVVGERTSTEVRLESGLSAGERVVVSGAFALRGELEKGELGHGHAH